MDIKRLFGAQRGMAHGFLNKQLINNSPSSLISKAYSGNSTLFIIQSPYIPNRLKLNPVKIYPPLIQAFLNDRKTQ